MSLPLGFYNEHTMSMLSVGGASVGRASRDGEEAVGTFKNARIRSGLGLAGYKASSKPSVSMLCYVWLAS